MHETEDVILHLLTLEFPPDQVEAQQAHLAVLTKARASRRRMAERIESLKIARHWGWACVKNYENRKLTGGDKDLLLAIEETKKAKEKSALEKKKERRFSPYKSRGLGQGTGVSQPLASYQNLPGMAAGMSPAFTALSSQVPGWLPQMQMQPVQANPLQAFAGLSSLQTSAQMGARRGRLGPRQEGCFKCGKLGHMQRFCPEKPE